MALSKSQKRALQSLDPQFRFAWMKALSAQTDASSVAAIAEMLEFQDTWELAFSQLEERVKKYPAMVAIQLLYALRRITNDRQFQMGVRVFKSIPKQDRDAAIDQAEAKVPFNSAKQDAWHEFVRKLNAAMRRK